MIYLDRLKIQNIIPYKEAEIDLGYGGVPGKGKVTVIYGQNHDAKVRGRNNGSGKSRLLRPIPLLMFKNPVLQTGKRSVKSSYSKDSQVSLDFHLSHQPGNHMYSYSCSKGKEYDILRDGKPSKMRTQGYAEQAIQKMIPLSEEEYYSLYHIDSRRPSLLQMGKEAARLEFFTQMFRLDDFDNLRRSFASEMNDLKGEQKSLKEVNAILDRMRGRVSITIEEVEKEQLELQINIAQTEKLLDKHRSSMEDMRTASVLAPAIARLERIVPKCEDWVNEVATRIKKRSRTLVAKLSSVRQWQDYRLLLARVKEDYVHVKKQIQLLVDEHALDIDLWQQNKESWAMAMVEKSVLQTDLKTLSKRIGDVVTAPSKTVEELTVRAKKLQSGLTVNEGEVSNCQRFLKLSKHIHSSDAQCPLCASELNGDVLRQLILTTEHKLEESQQTVERQRRLLEETSMALKEIEEYENQQELIVNKVKIQKRIKKLGELPTSIQMQAYEKVEQLQRRKDNIKRPEKPECEEPEETVEDLQSELDGYTAVKRDLELVLDSANLIDTDVSEEKLLATETKVSTLQQRLSNMNEKVFANRTLISQYENDRQQIEELENRSSDINSRLEDLPVYELLTEAYSNRGLKRIVVQNISRRIQDNLNKYSGLLNTEKVEYEFLVNPTTIDIIAHRQTGASDVCELSGAESRVFNFLMPLSIMSMIPERQRLNLMVMDEPLTALDDGLKDMFINHFLPSLQTIVPSVFIMEPTTTKYQADRVITAVRKNGSTTLQQKEIKNGY